MNKNFLLVVLIFAVVIVSACGQQSGNSIENNSAGQINNSADNNGEGIEKYELRLSVSQNDQNPEYKAIEKIRESVEERTDGKIKIETYHSDQLGSVTDLIEQAMVGATVGTITDAGRLGDIVQEFNILQSPYIVDNADEAKKLIESDLFKGWEQDLVDQGLKIIAFNLFLGERHLATTVPVQTPDDLTGVVIRTNGSQIVDNTISTMGAEPTGLPWTEAYPALQQGVIDGVEAHYSAIYESKLHEVINHIAKTNHYQLQGAIVVGADWFNSLPEEFQQILVEEAVNAGEYASQLSSEISTDYEEKMISTGIEVHEVDTNKFKEQTNEVYEKMGLSDVREQVNQVLGK